MQTVCLTLNLAKSKVSQVNENGGKITSIWP